MEIESNVHLKELTNLKIGGRAKFFVEGKNATTIREAVLWANQHNWPILVLGGGTNLLLPDEGWPGLVIRIANRGIKPEGETLEIQAGTDMAELLEAMLSFKLSGLEWAGGLPGTFGGAVRGNAGAFGSEIKDSLSSVIAIDHRGRIRKFSREQCQFAYRASCFKRKPLIILSAVLRLSPCRDTKRSWEMIQEKIDFRRKKHPLAFPNVGSVFKNLTRREEVRKIIRFFPSIKARVRSDWGGKVPAAFLIERAGIKGMSLGGAKVSERHANFIINYQNATATDFVTLMRIVQRIVKELWGIELEPEIEVVETPRLLESRQEEIESRTQAI